MTNILSTIIIFICIYSLALTACSNHAANNPSVGKTLIDTSSTTLQRADPFSTDSKTVSKDELTKIYSQSIAQYIKAVNKEYKIDFDTLFFGKHRYGQPEDFPDIELPETIEHTQIRLLSPEVGLRKQKERKSLFYINLMGWVNNEKAEFIFVTFSNGSEHQFDCFINYKYNADLKEFELENARFENFLYKKE